MDVDVVAERLLRETQIVAQDPRLAELGQLGPAVERRNAAGSPRAGRLAAE